MLQRRPQRRSQFAELWHPRTGWLMLAALYLAGALMSLVIAVTMAVWWPLITIVVTVAATVGCTAKTLRR